MNEPRLTARVRLNRPLSTVWAYLGNHQNLLEYSNGSLGRVSIDGADAKERNGVGTKRQCVTPNGKDRFVERIVYYKAPYAFAYSVGLNTWGL
ncbi:MAG: SRPBCC family protein, partial [Bacteroidota bacterium]